MADANICESIDENGFVCNREPAHDGHHEFVCEITPEDSVVRVFREPQSQTESQNANKLDSLQDPFFPDNSDINDYSDVLPLREQVALWAGRVVRKEAQIESMLHVIHFELCGAGFSWAIVPLLFGRLIEDIQKMLKASGISDQSYVNDCLEALRHLKEAHLRRNKIVHEQWVIRQEPQGEQYLEKVPKGVQQKSGDPGTKWRIDEFQGCYEDLRKSFVRVSGIFWSIGAFLDKDPGIWSDMVPANREAIAGRFRMTGENHWEFESEVFTSQFNEQMQEKAEVIQAQIARLQSDYSSDEGI